MGCTRERKVEYSRVELSRECVVIVMVRRRVMVMDDKRVYNYNDTSDKMIR